MKTRYLYFIVFLLTVTLLSTSFAQDNTQVGLPEGAIARLGKGGINIMRFSPEGTRLAVGTDVGVWLYDVPDGKETALFTEHTGQVNALAFSQDGKILASGGSENATIHLWDLDTNTKPTPLTLAARRDSVIALTFYGRSLISLNGWGELGYWNVDLGDKLAESVKVDLFETVVFSADGKTLAVGRRDKKIGLWDIASGNRQANNLIGHARLLKNDDNDLTALAFSNDGKVLASGSEDKTVKLWDIKNSTRIATLKGHNGWITAVAFSEDGSILASGDANKTIKLWDIETKKARGIITGHKNTINALAFAPVGTPRYGMCLASGSADGTIRFWNPENGKELATFATGYTEWVKAVAFSENGTTLASAAFNGTVDIWSLKTWQDLTTFSEAHSDATDTVALSPNAKFFVCRGSTGLIAFKPDGWGMHGSFRGNNKMQLWNLTTGEELSIFQQDDHIGGSAVAFSPDNNIIAVGKRREIQAWHINTSVELFQLNSKSHLHRGKLIFSPDGRKVAASSRPQPPQVWDIETQHDITPPDLKAAEAYAFSPDNAMLAILNREGIYMWQFDAESENEPTFFPGNFAGFRSMTMFSPDSTILLVAAMEHLKLINVKTGEQLTTLPGHTEPMETLVFSHDGKTLASGSQDGTVLLWDWEKTVAKTTSEKEE